MRVVFMGTPAFAVPSLESLARHHDVVLVVTPPDRVSGRGSRQRPSAAKQAADELGIAVLQPGTLRGEAAAAIRESSPDVICVVAFGMLLPRDVLEIPRFGCLNVHASLLPKYRGAAPIQRAVLDGRPVTGVSIMRMEEGLDTGPYALQREVAIDERYVNELENELAHVGADALIEVLAEMSRSEVQWTEQDDSAATYASKVTKDDVALRPDIDVAAAVRRVRAATRRAPARACVGERELTVVRASISKADIAPGAVCLSEGVPQLGFAGGALALEVVRPAGRDDMPGSEWARGARLVPGECWRCTR